MMWKHMSKKKNELKGCGVHSETHYDCMHSNMRKAKKEKKFVMRKSKFYIERKKRF